MIAATENQVAASAVDLVMTDHLVEIENSAVASHSATDERVADQQCTKLLVVIAVPDASFLSDLQAIDRCSAVSVLTSRAVVLHPDQADSARIDARDPVLATERSEKCMTLLAENAAMSAKCLSDQLPANRFFAVIVLKKAAIAAVKTMVN